MKTIRRCVDYLEYPARPIRLLKRTSDLIYKFNNPLSAQHTCQLFESEKRDFLIEGHKVARLAGGVWGMLPEFVLKIPCSKIQFHVFWSHFT